MHNMANSKEEVRRKDMKKKWVADAVHDHGAVRWLLRFL